MVSTWVYAAYQRLLVTASEHGRRIEENGVIGWAIFTDRRDAVIFASEIKKLAKGDPM
jgi:hypothetical protein